MSMSISSVKEPLISVIIPCYNRKETLLRAFNSAVNQSYKNTEIILVDDASADGSANLIKELEKTDRRVKAVLSTVNLGAGGARNLGASYASGSWLAFLDSDDEWHPSKLQKQLSFLQLHPDVAMGYHSYQRIMLDGSMGPVYPDMEEEERISPEDTYASFLRECHVSTQTVMIKTHVFHEADGFDENFRSLEDNVLALCVARHHEVCYQKDILANVYASMGSVSQNVAGYFQARIQMIDTFFDDMAAYGVLEDVCDEILKNAERLELLELVNPVLQKTLLLHF